MNAACGWTLIRKTSLLRKINPMMRRSSFTKKDIYKLNHLAMIERRNVLEIMSGIPANCFAGSQTRIDLLYTMSEIPHAHPKGHDVRSDVSRTIILGDQSSDHRSARLRSFELRRGSLRYDGSPSRSWRSQRRLVEPDGIEPTTSCLQSTRSPS
jgi:hypothetical protein